MPVNRKVQVDLVFKADTETARQQLAQLQQQLNNVAATPITGKTAELRASLQNSIDKALELKVALQNATNVNTGKLNLTKFSQQLKANKTTLQDYAMSLQRLGPQGTQAFVQLANAIRQSETPLISLQGKMAELGVTLKNTIKWQLSSSVIHGTMSAISGVVDYAKDLNESLNSIRIVTGKSREEMSAFAKEANRAARSLSIGTNEYVKASLIYFQQGLNSNEVRERTDTTVKLANVVRQDAETVSEWMTAIWNNFDDGSRSLESYADVLAKLGAATASSADEIATGLEKFAAVGNTVGLSYDYAASALATITAQTRQSADVVGTALRTIFARIENLNLGDTLEDGTTLGKYSAALLKVGVDINDANGGLREMDDILDDIGDTWQTLGRDEQVALAQSVAGIRQYSQFIALMDNWDFMKDNVELSKEANGELEQQLLIYQDGIEGATARVNANLEKIKNSLLDENDLLPWINGTDKILSVTSDLIDALGGLPGLLSIIASWALKIYGPQAAAGLNSIVMGIQAFGKSITGQAQTERSDMIRESGNLARGMAANTGAGQYGIAQSQILGENAAITEKMEGLQKRLTKEQQQQLEFDFQLLQLEQQRALELAKIQENAAETADDLERQLKSSGVDANSLSYLRDRASIYGRTQGIEKTTYSSKEDLMTSINDVQKDFNKRARNGEISQEQLEATKNARNKVKKAAEDYYTTLADVQDLEKKGLKINDETVQKLNTQKKALDKAKSVWADAARGASGYNEALKETKEQNKDAEKEINNFVKAEINAADASEQGSVKLKQEGEHAEQFSQKMDDMGGRAAHWSIRVTEGIQQVAQGLAAMQMAWSGIDSMAEAFTDSEFSLSKFLSGLTSTIFAAAQLASILGNLSKALKGVKQAQDAENATTLKSAALKLKKAIAAKISGKATEQEAKDTEQANAREDASNIKTAITGLIKQLGQGPAGWVTAAIAAAAIAALGVAIAVNVKSAANAKKVQQETAQSDFEEAKSAVEAHDSTYSSYTKLYDQYKKTGDGREELAKSAKELAEAYNIEGAAVAQLSGDYDRLNKAITKARTEELEDLYRKAGTNIAVNEGDFRDAAQKNKSAAAAKRGELQSFGLGDKQNESALLRAVNESNSQYVKNIGSRIVLNAGNLSSAEIARAYEDVEKILHEAQENGIDTSASEGYKGMLKWLADTKEQYEKYIENEESEMSAFGQTQVLNARSGNSLSISEVTTFTEYLSLRTEALQGLHEGTKEYEAVVKALSSQTNTGDFETRAKAIEEQSKNLSQKEKDRLKTAYTNASEAMVRAMSSVEMTEGMSWDEFEKAANDNLEKAARGLKLDTAENYKVLQQQADTYTKVLKTYNNNLRENAYLAEIATEASIHLNGEMEKLIKTWNENNEALLNANVNTAEYSYALSAVATSLGDTFGTDVDLTNFVHTHKQLIAEFLNGNLELFDNIQLLIGQEVAETYKDVDNLDVLFTMLGNKDYKIGDNVDISKYKDKINEIISSSEKGVEAIRRVANVSGYDVQFSGTGKDSKIKSITRVTDEDSLNSKLFEANKKATKNRIKQLKDEADRYHEINEIISDTKRELDSLDKAKNKAYGATHLANLDKEIDKQKELIRNNQQLLREAEQYYNEDRKNLLNNYAVRLDSAGRISNYEELQRAYIQRLNGLANNAKGYDSLKEQYDDFEKAVSKYEQSLNKVEEQVENINDELDKLSSYRLEKIQYTVQIKVDIAEDDKAYLDFLRQKIENDDFAAAEAINLLGREANDALQKVNAYQQGIEEVEAALKRGEITQEDAVEQLREYRDELISTNADLLELRESVQERLTAAFDAWNDKIDKSREKIERFGSVLEHYKNIIDIVGKDALGIGDEIIRGLSEAQLNNIKDLYSSVSAQRDANQAFLDEAYAARKAAAAKNDAESVKEWDKQIELAEQKAAELSEEVRSIFEEMLEQAKTNFEEVTNQIADNFSKSASGIYDSLEKMREGWDRQQEVADRYLTTYQQTYEVSKLNRKIQQDIEKSGNIKNQKELRQLQQEMLNMSKDGQQLSKYDLEYLQKKYDLLVAEQAFRDAQNAKSIVRLRRDSQGNFGYVYTADQNATDAAEQTYEDRLYAFQEFSNNMDKELAEAGIKLNEWVRDQLLEAANLYGLGTAAFETEANAILQKADEDWAYISGEYQKFTDRNLDMNRQFNAGLADTYNQTFLGRIYPDYNNFKDQYAGTTGEIQKSIGELKDAQSQYQSDVQDIFELAGKDVSNFKDEVVKQYQQIRTDSSNTSKATQTMANDMRKAMDTAINYVQSFQNAYSRQMESVRKATDDTITRVNALIKSYKELIDKAGVAAAAQGSGSSKAAIGTGGSPGSGGSNTSGQNLTNYTPNTSSSVSYNNTSGINSVGDTYPLINASFRAKNADYITTYDEQGNKIKTMTLNDDQLQSLKKKELVYYMKKGDTNLFKLSSPLADMGGYYTWWLNKTDLKQLLNGTEGFMQVNYGSIKLGAGHGNHSTTNRLMTMDTGGYTGAWGPEGRLALLHQKEIVLNAHDTENFLSAIGIVRDISDQIEKNALVMQTRSAFNGSATVSTGGETLQQEVTIHAEFPNATNHSEIEEAFRNLTNYASQYANRKS